MSSNILALTSGEPAGIGPDLLVQIAQHAWPRPLVVIADRHLLEDRAAKLRLPLTLIEAQGQTTAAAAGSLYIEHTPLHTDSVAGELNSANSPYVLKTLDIAAQGCIRGDYAGMVTPPVHKGIINDAGISFSGHTEYLAAISGGHPVMMLACPGLRVALATTHLALRDVADAITTETLEQVLRVLHKDLTNRFSIEQPNILVCGLNPHAGESGHMGKEEIDIIEPLLSKLRAEGMLLSEPLPADTLFTPKYLDRADAVLAMYHDQGLPVLKHKGFGNAVNITLGLPIIRTSVDHGTALELAATGKANAGSMIAAIEQAILLSSY